MIDDKTFKSVLASAKSGLPFVPADSVYDDLYSAAGMSIAAHLANGGKADKALLVRVAKCEMIDELRRNKQRFRVETGGVEDLLQRVPDGAQSPAPQELPRRRSKKKPVIQVDARVLPFLDAVDQRIVELAQHGKNQSEIGESINGDSPGWTPPVGVCRLSQPAVAKRIAKIRAQEQKWLAKGYPVHHSKHIDA